ncbi:SBBP repeat-containing protein [Microcoleus sp. FACHB-1515]|uniref:SBBP repeat-containing protein n=1 Tax=Cyanophyceae TaxID=3028117 RepID=UPI0016862AC4|nr:SBBP repeat-containing protein [Microcoleus sp. FACHB-1515]MBD2091234.1 SBBP repeat-containing protein [Microcoleus sp. FACHB-1515]
MTTSDQLDALLKTLPALLSAAYTSPTGSTSSSTFTASTIDPAEQAFGAIGNFYNLLFQTLLSTDDALPASPYDALFTTLTPASDLVFAGFGDYQLVFGRTGDDVLYPFDQRLNSAGQTPIQIDLFFGDSEVIKRFLFQDFLNILGGNPPAGGADTFVLGDWKTSYYSRLDYNDFNLIFDFNSRQDKIQLRGSASDYELVTVPFLGTAIFEKKSGSTSVFENDLIGIVFANYNLDLTSPNFKYAGTAPAIAPSQPKIKQFGTAGLELGTAIATDLQSNLYVVGATNGVIQGANSGSYDSWITKYNSEGDPLWSKQFGTSKYDIAFGATTDRFGNLYVVGGTQGDLAGSFSSVAQDSWIAKYDSNGNQLWVRQLGSEYLTAATNIVADDSGAVYVSGLTVREDPRPDTNLLKVIPLQDDFWVTKYDANGDRQWFTEVASPENSVALFDEAYGITLGRDGTVYATGWTYGDFSGQGGSLETFRYYDAWLAKFDNATGQLEKLSPNPNQEVVQFGSPSFDFSWGLGIDSQQNLYNVGWTLGSLGGPNAGQEDIWLAKTRPDGTQAWIRQFGTSGADGLYLGSLVVDAQDRLFIAGYTNGNLGGTNAGGFDAWVASYDTSGNQLWMQQFGSAETDYATKLTVDQSGNLYVTGFTEGSLGAANAGAIDTWIAKLNANTGSLQNFNPVTVPIDQSEIIQPPQDRPSERNMIGTARKDYLIGTAKSNQMEGRGNRDLLIGKNGDDRLLGGGGVDRLEGGSGADQLQGDAGNDILEGGAGTDQFIFNTGKAFKRQDLGVDKILDFSEADSIVLGKRTFTALKSRRQSFSHSKEFAIVATNQAARESRALIVYNANNNRLFYNPNGAVDGFGKGGAFAALANRPTLTANDFSIQA